MNGGPEDDQADELERRQATAADREEAREDGRGNKGQSTLLDTADIEVIACEERTPPLRPGSRKSMRREIETHQRQAQCRQETIELINLNPSPGAGR